MRACLAGIMAATVVAQSVPAYAAEPNNAAEAVEEPGMGADVTVRFVDENDKLVKEVKTTVTEGVVNYSIFADMVPSNYVMQSGGDFTVANGDVITVRVSAINEEREVYISLIDADDKTAVGAPQTIKIGKNDTTVSTSKLTIPEGYELAYGNGDVYVGEGDSANVEVRKIKEATEREVYISLIDVDDKTAVGAPQTIKIGKNDTTVSTSKLTIPEGYELAYGNGDVYVGEGDSANVEVRKVEKVATLNISFETVDGQKVGDSVLVVSKDELVEYGKDYNLPEGYTFADGYELKNIPVILGTTGGTVVLVQPIKVAKTVYVSYIDADTKMPLENAIETLTLEEGTTYFNANVLKEVPEGYELVTTGDVYVGEGDTVNVEVRKAAKIVYVSYIDADTKMPLENAIETLKLEAGATYFNASVLKEVPEGYELVTTGDVFVGNNDTVNVEVRKAEKTVYVSYIDADTKMPLENAIETIKLAANVTYFNTNMLKEIPEGYTLAVAGDVFVGDNDTVNVEVRKAEKTVYVSYIDEETKMPFENGIEEIKVPADANSFNTSILKNVPAGYELCVVGDIAFEGDSLNVEVRKVVNFEYVKVTYVDADNGEFVVGYGTAKVEKGAAYFNTSTLTDVPYGYEIAEAGDMVIANGEATVKVRKIDNVQEVTITYVHKTTGDVVGYGKLNAYKDETYFNTSRLTDIPEGYVLADVGDMPIEEGAATVYVYAATDMEELQPSKPVEPSKPAKPADKNDKNDNKKDDKKTSAKTGDETNPIAAVLPAGISLAAILALLKKRK